jgi:hypothetical protein
MLSLVNYKRRKSVNWRSAMVGCVCVNRAPVEERHSPLFSNIQPRAVSHKV